MYDPNATLIGAQSNPAPRYDPNATLIGAQSVPQQQHQYYDPNATLMGVQPVPQQRYDPNATLIGAQTVPQQRYDPNATLMGVPGADPNATLMGVAGPDPNATLLGGGPDPNATLMGGPMLVNNSAFIHQQMNAQPQVIPHIRLIPHNSYFQVLDRDVLRTLKFGRTGEVSDNDPDFIGYNSRVVSRRHAEIWAVNNEFYIRDTRSQSGTFLNAMRLSLPGEESKPFKLKNGDTIQFGVDRKGGTTPDTKCVSVTCEVSFKKNTPQPQAAPQGYGQPMYAQPAYAQQPGYAQPGQQAVRPMASFSDLTLIGGNQGGRK